MTHSEQQQPAKSEHEIRIEKLETIINELKADKETKPDLSWLTGKGFGHGGVVYSGEPQPPIRTAENRQESDLSWLQGQGFKRSDFLVDKDE